MAKFDKNMKNDFLDSDNFFEEEDLFEEEDPFDEEDHYYDDEGQEYDDDQVLSEEGSNFEDDGTVEEDPDAENFSQTENNLTMEDDASIEHSEEVSSSGSDEKQKAEWYVVHTYSGHENKVKANIEKLVENRGMQDLITSVVMPMEDIVEMKDGQRKVRTRKMFPGYVIVKMVMTSETWYLVRNTQGVTGFVGHGSDPIPLTEAEVRNMGIEKTLVNIDLEIGDAVKVTDGPFDSYMGIVEDINTEKQTIRVRISMFGRETPVELEFSQIEKVAK